MLRINSFISENPITAFLILTCALSLISLVLMLSINGAHTPENSIGLPIWLIAIWSPNIAAIIVWILQKNLITNLQKAFTLPPFTWWSTIVLLPFLIAAILIIVKIYEGETIEWSKFKFSYLLPLFILNLLMGPLGEELGWRGFLLPSIKVNYGWLMGALIVGVIWAVWHAPLWFVDSPQSKIPFWAFFITVVCLSILMAILHNNSNGSLWYIILLHLTFNISLGLIDILGTYDPGEFVIKCLYFYVPITLVILLT